MNFREMQQDAEQQGLRGDLEALNKRVEALEQEVRALTNTVKELRQANETPTRE